MTGSDDLRIISHRATMDYSDLNECERERVELRANHMYRSLPSSTSWGCIDRATRDEFRRRALRLMLFDGSLLHGALPGSEDYGYTELQELDSEVTAVVRGELRAGELWQAESEDGGADYGH